MMRRILILVALLTLIPLAYAAAPTVSGVTHLAPTYVNKSQQNVALFSFTLTTTDAYPGGKWTGSGAFKATTYTGSPYDLSRVALYADDGDNVSDTSKDTLCGSATTSYLNKYSFKPALACNLAQNTPQTFFVVVDIASNATTGNAIDLRIDANDLSFVGGTAPSSAIDPAGQAYVEQIIPDDTPPVTAHDAPSTWVKAPITVQLTCTDSQSGCDKVTAELDGVQSSATGNSLSVAVTGNGVHTLEFWSEDNSGNIESHQTINVSIDTVKPTLAGYLISPTLGKAGDVITFTATFDDNLSGIEHAVSPLITWENEPAYCDDTFVQGNYSSNVWTGTVTIPTGCDGTASIVVADVQDVAGNKITQIVVGNFTIDNTAPPASQLLAPLNNALTNNATQTFTWMTNSSDVDHYLFELSTEANFSTLEETANVSINVSSYVAASLSDNTYYWRVGAVDAVGHVTYSSARAFILSSDYIAIYKVPLDAGNTLTNTYDGVQLNITVTSDATLFIATHTDTSGTPSGYSDDWGNEYDFSITDPSAVNGDITLLVHYTSTDIAGLNENSLRLGWYDGGWDVFPTADSGVDTTGNYAWAKTSSFIHVGGFGNTQSGRSPSISYSSGIGGFGPGGGGSEQVTQPTEASNSEQQEASSSELVEPIPDEPATQQEEPADESSSTPTGSFLAQSPIKNAFFAILVLLIVGLVLYGSHQYFKKPKEPEYPQF